MKRILLSLLIASPVFSRAQVAEALEVTPDQYTAFERGSSHALLADNVNVRKTASANGAVVTKLPIGTWVEITAKGAPFTMNGIEAPWYQVSFPSAGKKMSGFVWGGLIAAETDTSQADPTLFYHFGLSKVVAEDEGATNTLVQVRAERGNKEIGRLEFDGIGSSASSHTTTVKSPGGLRGIADILEFDFNDGFCAGGFGQTYLAFTGSAFVNLITCHDGFDAPMAYDERVIFPSDEGGVAGKVLFIAESNEEDVAKLAEAEGEETSGIDPEMKVVETLTYIWDGSKLVVVED